MGVECVWVCVCLHSMCERESVIVYFTCQIVRECKSEFVHVRVRESGFHE